MRIVALSDTHNFRVRDVPEGDVLIHAGDATIRGKPPEIEKFAQWYGGLPHQHKLFVAGNHDWLFEKNPAEARKIMEHHGITYLQDEAVIIDNIKFYGSPWQPEYHNWAFGLPRGAKIAEKWALIPDDTDVLVTHGPAKGILDQVGWGPHLGCEELDKRISQLKQLKLHIFGHIHDSYGRYWDPNTRYASLNVAQCTERYALLNKPMVEEL